MSIHFLLNEQKYHDQILVINIHIFASRLVLYQADEAILPSKPSSYLLKKQELL
ncbi:MAG: hypothetical protein ACEY3J_03155 [Arsenophonus sp.]